MEVCFGMGLALGFGDHLEEGGRTFVREFKALVDEHGPKIPLDDPQLEWVASQVPLQASWTRTWGCDGVVCIVSGHCGTAFTCIIQNT
ncbi:hypothetical protein ARMSODRAFT_181577 [Armillaria solidipes]|uniref:Uncharacterized protein n=1 Tax=Armillaria solidipes TaxID=1076256 RepID=A0A2H3BT61_9AGAR|nr:hypothetical protein ARMSODRAFT_181577 [Armillaria solidipes]